MGYDESDHVVVRGSRVVTDRVGDAFGSVMNQSDMALALAEIRKIDRSFDKEKFIERCRFEIIPTVLEAYIRGDLEALKDWCHEAVSCYDVQWL
jgi:import inner membrane translocase subunit TIM44